MTEKVGNKRIVISRPFNIVSTANFTLEGSELNTSFSNSFK
jgi:hypothetical protein